MSDKPFPGSVIESSEYDKESGWMKQKIRVAFFFFYEILKLTIYNDFSLGKR